MDDAKNVRMVTTFHEFYQRWLGRADLMPESIVCSPCTGAALQLKYQSPNRESSRHIRDQAEKFINPFSKCCAYFPYLPNFTIGKLLQQNDPQILTHIASAISTGVATPLGIFASNEHLEKPHTKQFVQNAEILCPFFDSVKGNCAIWNHRPGVCLSYYCQSSFGKSGQEFWKNNEARINLFEWTMAHVVLWRLGFTQNETNTMDPNRKNDYSITSGGFINGNLESWYEYKTKKYELYKESFRRACEVSPFEIKTLMNEPK